MAKIDRLFRFLSDQGGSDLHLVEGQPPKVRLHGELVNIKHPVLDHATMQDYLSEICDPKKWQDFQTKRDLDFAYESKGIARFRSNYFHQEYGLGAVFRIIPSEIRNLSQLNLPEVILEFARLTSGLVLVTGPTGSGKSTTLAAIIDFMNDHFYRRIITIEDPVEFSHRNKKCVIMHREVGTDARSFASALHAATRQDPDVILVGEMRDLETISLAISAAEMGKLVLATLHTNSAPKTIDRVIDAFPEDSQGQVRTQLAESLKGVVSQLLCRTVDGKGRVAVNEVLIGSPALANVIREGQIGKIYSIIEGGRGEGMMLMDDSLIKYLKAGKITPQEAYIKGNDKKKFQAFLPADFTAT